MASHEELKAVRLQKRNLLEAILEWPGELAQLRIGPACRQDLYRSSHAQRLQG